MSRKDHLIMLIGIHDRRLQKLYEKHAKLGVSADPAIKIEIEDIEFEIEKLQSELDEIEGKSKSLFSSIIEVYGGDEKNEVLKNKLFEIESLFVNAEYHEAYKKFKDLCSSYPAYKDHAISILARFNDLINNKVIPGVISYEEQKITIQEIGDAFFKCLKRFRNEYL